MTDYYIKPPKISFEEWIEEMKRVCDETQPDLGKGQAASPEEPRCYLCQRTCEESGSLKRKEKFFVCDDCHEQGPPNARHGSDNAT